MDPELGALEAKLAQLVERLDQLREENRELRQQLANRTDENARLSEKLAAAKSRMAALNIAHETLSNRTGGAALDGEAFRRRIVAMQETVDSALTADQEKLF